MKRLLLPLLLLVPLNVNGEDYKCPGQNTIEMEYCSSIDLKKSRMWLEDQLSQEVEICCGGKGRGAEDVSTCFIFLLMNDDMVILCM